MSISHTSVQQIIHRAGLTGIITPEQAQEIIIGYLSQQKYYCRIPVECVMTGKPRNWRNDAKKKQATL
jgi:hypothetical protein